MRQAGRRLAGRFLRVPLFYKILLANGVLVLLGTLAGTALARGVLRGEMDHPLVLGFGLVLGAVLVTVLINAGILRLALSPLKSLEWTASEIQAGDLDARVPDSPLGDADFERLTATFNGMLDNLEAYRQRLSGIAARALNAEEEERKRIARELHDDTAQSLAALLIRLRLLRGVEDGTARDRIVDELRTEVGEALERIRRFARGLRPPALEELGLVPALESHVRSLSESVGIPIRFDAQPIEDGLGQQAELALYRIAQEATSNAVRHANPERVVIRLTRVGANIQLQVEDDGIGFLLGEVTERQDGGLGIFGMQERAGYVGGQVRIDTAPGRGTRVDVLIPAPKRRRAT